MAVCAPPTASVSPFMAGKARASGRTSVPSARLGTSLACDCVPLQLATERASHLLVFAHIVAGAGEALVPVGRALATTLLLRPPQAARASAAAVRLRQAGGLLGLDASGLDHLAPLLGFGRLELGEFIGRGGPGF